MTVKGLKKQTCEEQSEVLVFAHKSPPSIPPFMSMEIAASNAVWISEFGMKEIDIVGDIVYFFLGNPTQGEAVLFPFISFWAAFSESLGLLLTALRDHSRKCYRMPEIKSRLVMCKVSALLALSLWSQEKLFFMRFSNHPYSHNTPSLKMPSNVNWIPAGI